MVLHGKGGPDGEGAMYKNGLRQGEPLGDYYMQTSKQSFDWLHKQEEKQEDHWQQQHQHHHHQQSKRRPRREAAPPSNCSDRLLHEPSYHV
jgi:hypothetical protein